MSPNEMLQWREQFNQACRSLGWRQVRQEHQHDRDWDCTWTEEVWQSADGEFLFSEDDLTEGMLQEIIRLAAAMAEVPPDRPRVGSMRTERYISASTKDKVSESIRPKIVGPDGDMPPREG